MNNSSELNNNENSYTMIKIVALLIGLQVSRIALKQSAFLFLSYNKFNDVLISMIVMFLLTLFVIYKSKKEKVSLDIFSYMKNKETYYVIVTGAVLLLIFTSPSFLTKTSIESIIPLLYTAIMTPIYEELLFRSYIWNVLKQDNEDEVKVYFLTTVLFSIYHIGYIDTIIMTSGFNQMALMILIKCSLMLSYGFFIGFFRYKIKNSYSCILVHSFINIFSR